ncbi:hypothetical protein [Flavihumibacter sp. ZG627]|uniref:hypothetical protein n=1 Tax=Flavihumibacter sp. ZG627 TaxID=1463156 RepID=UPI00057F19F7|nr:hypothetical protein [Flavihumibacter sp. ZG627]KIC90806.1 hypothetical protein HY58_07045 [Flavihumibacter sp. ZG627]
MLKIPIFGNTQNVNRHSKKTTSKKGQLKTDQSRQNIDKNKMGLFDNFLKKKGLPRKNELSRQGLGNEARRSGYFTTRVGQIPIKELFQSSDYFEVDIFKCIKNAFQVTIFRIEFKKNRHSSYKGT